MDVYQIVALTDGTVPREAIDASLVQVNRIYEAQLGVHVEITAYEVRIDLPKHNNPMAFVHDFQTLLSTAPTHAEQTADASIAFVARELFVGSNNFAGYATVAPLCSAYQAGVVRGSDYQVFAHEVAHTMGIDHDALPGYLMSAGDTLTDEFSPQSVATYKQEFNDCMQVATVSVEPSVKAASAQHNDAPHGGGGATTYTLIALMIGLAWARSALKIVTWVTRLTVRSVREYSHIETDRRSDEHQVQTKQLLLRAKSLLAVAEEGDTDPAELARQIRAFKLAVDRELYPQEPIPFNACGGMVD